MGIKVIDIAIKGTSPLLMHSYPMAPIEAMEKKTPAEQAELSAYRDPDTGYLYIPGTAVQRCLVGAAVYSKGKGRASLQKSVAACVLVAPERCLTEFKTFEIDVRPVVMPATKGRVLRYRPRLDVWGIAFSVEYDDNLIRETELRHITDDAGTRVGLLDFRPERKGPFGRFMVTSWAEA